MAIKWTKEWTNEYGITAYKAKVKGLPVGKHITRGGVIEYVWRGHFFDTEADLIARVKEEIGRHAPGPGSYNVTTMPELGDEPDRDRKPVIVKAKDSDEAAKKGMVKMKLEAEGYQGYLLVTDHEGERVAYRLDDSEGETSQFWRK